MQRTAESKAKNAGPPFFFPPEELHEKFYTKERKFDFQVLEFPTEEDCLATPGFFMEGVAHVYQQF